jgi:hypothetical protein
VTVLYNITRYNNSAFVGYSGVCSNEGPSRRKLRATSATGILEYSVGGGGGGGRD